LQFLGLVFEILDPLDEFVDLDAHLVVRSGTVVEDTEFSHACNCEHESAQQHISEDDTVWNLRDKTLH